MLMEKSDIRCRIDLHAADGGRCPSVKESPSSWLASEQWTKRLALLKGPELLVRALLSNGKLSLGDAHVHKINGVINGVLERPPGIGL
jgi:hypothetical protein